MPCIKKVAKTLYEIVKGVGLSFSELHILLHRREDQIDVASWIGSH